MWRAVSNVMTTYACISLSNQGILAGMRPCGIILMLHELFTAESKTQVYGCLHNYYSLHPSTAKTIGLSLPQEQTKLIHMYIHCMCIVQSSSVTMMHVTFENMPEIRIELPTQNILNS